MTDMEILRQMIKDSAQVALVDSYDKKMAELTEPQRPNSSVKVFGIPEAAIVIKADEFAPPLSVFRDVKGECKRADFIIVAEADNIKVIICIELKSGRHTVEQEIIQQLKGALCFVGYCKEVGREFWNTPKFLDGYSYRFICIKNISIPKRRTRFDKRIDVHDRPDKMLKISGQRSLQFNHLAGSNR